MMKDEDFYLFVAGRMAALRKARGLTQNEASKLAGLKLTTWGNYEAGDRMFNGLVLTKIARGLKTTSSYILGETELMDGAGSEFTVLTGGQARSNCDVNYLAFSSEELRKMGYRASDLLTIKVRDDAIDNLSMGDAVVIDTSQRDINQPGLFAIKTESGHYWLRYIRPEMTGGYTLYCDNKTHYPDVFYANEKIDSINVVGKYVGNFHWEK